MISACRQWVRLSPRIPLFQQNPLWFESEDFARFSFAPLPRASPDHFAGAPRGLDRLAKIGQKALLPLFVVSHPPASRALHPCRLPCASALPVSAPLEPRLLRCSAGRPRRCDAGPAGNSRLPEFRPAKGRSSGGSI